MASPLWSLPAPLAEPLLPAGLPLPGVPLSVPALTTQELGGPVPVSASPTEWEEPPWRKPGLSPQTGSSLSRALSSLSDSKLTMCQHLSPPSAWELWEGRHVNLLSGRRLPGQTVSLWIGRAPSPLGWELCEGSVVSPPFDEVLGQGQSPPSAWSFPGLGCGSTRSLGAP